MTLRVVKLLTICEAEISLWVDIDGMSLFIIIRTSRFNYHIGSV